MQAQQVDVLIVGAGPVGLCLTRALASSGLSLVLVEQQKRSALQAPAFDGREIALTHASRAILHELGIWQRIDEGQISPLRNAKVFNGRSPFALEFAAEQENVEALGWLVPNHLIRQAAWQAIQEQNELSVVDGTSVTAIEADDQANLVRLADGRQFSARLVVAADSRFSTTRRMLGIGAQMRDFGQSMLICRMQHEQPHHHTAWEWFDDERTLALLPLLPHNGQHCASAVMTLEPAQIQELLALDDQAFGAAVTGFFSHRLGAMQPVGSRHVYPLVAVYAQRLIGPRYALVGDAAVGMHPVTAHGFNFGLQSQRRLAQKVLTAARQGNDIAAPAVLAAYQRQHRIATRPLYEATNSIAALYSQKHLPARLLRPAALRLAQAVPPFRKLIAAHLTQQKACA